MSDICLIVHNYFKSAQFITLAIQLLLDGNRIDDIRPLYDDLATNNEFEISVKNMLFIMSTVTFDQIIENPHNTTDQKINLINLFRLSKILFGKILDEILGHCYVNQTVFQLAYNLT